MSKKVLLTSVCRPLGPKSGDAPTILVSLDGKQLWRGKITSEEASVYRFEAQTAKRRGLLSIKMLKADGSGVRPQGSVLIDKVVVRKPS